MPKSVLYILFLTCCCIYIFKVCVQGTGILRRSDRKQNERMKFEIQSLGLLVLHCNPLLLHCIGKISYQSSLYCGPFV